MDDMTKCPFTGGATQFATGWPNQLDLQALHRNSTLSDPMGETFRLRQGIQEPRPSIAVIKDLQCLDDRHRRRGGRPTLATTAPLFIRHGVAQRAGTYPPSPNGRGGAGGWPAALSPRPLNSWPDQRETSTKARRAACCGRSGRNTTARKAFPGPTMMILAGKCRPRLRWVSRTFGFGGGRARCLGARRSSTGVPRGSGWGTKRYSGRTRACEIRSAPCRWA